MLGGKRNLHKWICYFILLIEKLPYNNFEVSVFFMSFIEDNNHTTVMYPASLVRHLIQVYRFF